jgi:hypothetical protein
MGASELAAAIRRRFPHIDSSLEADLLACEDASWSETVDPRVALKLIQGLHAQQNKLDAAKPGGGPPAQEEKSTPQERAS